MLQIKLKSIDDIEKDRNRMRKMEHKKRPNKQNPPLNSLLRINRIYY